MKAFNAIKNLKCYSPRMNFHNYIVVINIVKNSYMVIKWSNVTYQKYLAYVVYYLANALISKVVLIISDVAVLSSKGLLLAVGLTLLEDISIDITSV